MVFNLGLEHLKMPIHFMHATSIYLASLLSQVLHLYNEERKKKVIFSIKKTIMDYNTVLL